MNVAQEAVECVCKTGMSIDIAVVMLSAVVGGIAGFFTGLLKGRHVGNKTE